MSPRVPRDDAPRPVALADDPAEHDPEHLGTVLVTGVCGRLGRRLVRRLHRVARVLGVDRRPFPGKPKDVEHHAVDLRRKKTQDVFRGERVDAVVHLGVMHDPRASQDEHHSWNVAGFSRLADYVSQYGVKKLVVLSSANVYGPRPDNPQFLTEDAPLLGGARFGDIRDLVEVDMLAQSFHWKESRCETVILRPVHIVGSVRNAPSNYLRLPVIPVLFGFDPMVQVVHEDDVVDAVLRALRPGARGVLNLAGPPAIALSRLVALTKKPTLPLPHSLLRPALSRLFRMRASSFPAPELDHIRFVCMVDDGRARRVLGYAHRHDHASIVRAAEAHAPVV